jgi:N-acetylneuraminic acid mutarotase
MLGPRQIFRRSRYPTYSLLAACLLLQACGGGGGGGGNNSGTAPTISNLSYSPNAVYVGAAGSTQLVHGEFDFSDPDGDIASGTLEALDAGGAVLDSQTFQITGVSGVTAGTVAVDVEANTSSTGNFTVRVSLTDRRGLVSNKLSGTFRVSAFPWVARASMPLPRREFATATINGKIYVLGGGDTQAPAIPAPATGSVQVYDPATDSWSAAAPMPVAAYDHAAAVAGGKIYVAGGKSDLAPGLKTLQEYDPATDSWVVKADMPVELSGNAATGAAGLLFVFGGSSGGFDTANALEYDPSIDRWTSRAPLLQPLRNAAAVTVGGMPLVLGGYGSTSVADAGYFRLVQQYDPSANAWMQRTDMDLPRSDFGAALIDATLYAAGGGNWVPALQDLGAYDVATGTWTAKTQLPVALAWPRAEAVSGKMYVFDGSNTFEYTPSNDIL